RGRDGHIFDHTSRGSPLPQLLHDEQRIGAGDFAVQRCNEETEPGPLADAFPMFARLLQCERLATIDAALRQDAHDRGQVGGSRLTHFHCWHLYIMVRRSEAVGWWHDEDL